MDVGHPMCGQAGFTGTVKLTKKVVRLLKTLGTTRPMRTIGNGKERDGPQMLKLHHRRHR